MQQTDYSHMPQFLQRPIETHVALQVQRLEKEYESQGLAKYYRQFSLVQLQQGIRKDDMLKKGNRKKVVFSSHYTLLEVTYCGQQLKQ